MCLWRVIPRNFAEDNERDILSTEAVSCQSTHSLSEGHGGEIVKQMLGLKLDEGTLVMKQLAGCSRTPLSSHMIELKSVA